MSYQRKQIIFLAYVLVLFGILPAAGQKLEIKRVGLDKKSFNPSANEQISLSFEITAPADVNIIFYDELGRQVRLFELQSVNAGRHEFNWDGADSEGKQAPGRLFLYVIEAVSKDNQKIIYNPAEETGGLEMKALEFSLDKKTGRIEYVLPSAAMVRIRVGLNDGFFAGNVLDWQNQTAGRHIIEWDGKDSSGLINLLRNPNLNLRLSCCSLPANSIIAEGTKRDISTEVRLSKEQRLIREKLWGTKGKYIHYRCDRRYCHQPQFSISFPNGKKVENGILISGVTPIRIELSERDKEHLINTKFEVMLFVDGIYLYEMEEGSSPFTYNWDTRLFSRGPVILSVNIIGYDDHIGSKSCRVIIGD
ncbi:MAG: hypothetical protein JW804_01350 [Sedimentisphaerales bacterium]|nr:hypothetical protein [Sedimentisphaerales bacterium]